MEKFNSNSFKLNFTEYGFWNILICYKFSFHTYRITSAWWLSNFNGCFAQSLWTFQKNQEHLKLMYLNQACVYIRDVNLYRKKISNKTVSRLNLWKLRYCAVITQTGSKLLQGHSHLSHNSCHRWQYLSNLMSGITSSSSTLTSVQLLPQHQTFSLSRIN